jgi:hypothetical protein
MDLLTLISACALSVDPNIVHALIWEQSGGEPWSFSVPGEAMPRVLPTIQEAIREVRALRPEGGHIRVGLAGLSTDPRSVTAVLFAPCPNITLAAQQITRLAERCKMASRPDPIYCAIAVYRGSWDRPDTKFVDAVRATVEKGNAPNFDLPKDAYFDASDIASDTPMPGAHAALNPPASAPDDLVRGWSSALFPEKSPKPDSTFAERQSGDRGADERRSPSPAGAAPAASKAPVDSLFVPRSSERRP